VRVYTWATLSVLTVSMSITVLNAFSDKPPIGAKKLPAAPAQAKRVNKREPQFSRGRRTLTADDKVNPAKFSNRLRHSLGKGWGLAHVCLGRDTCTTCGLGKCLRCLCEPFQPASQKTVISRCPVLQESNALTGDRRSPRPRRDASILTNRHSAQRRASVTSGERKCGWVTMRRCTHHCFRHGPTNT
jgi:hypothetical protein